MGSQIRNIFLYAFVSLIALSLAILSSLSLFICTALNEHHITPLYYFCGGKAHCEAVDRRSLVVIVTIVVVVFIFVIVVVVLVIVIVDIPETVCKTTLTK